MSTNTSSALPDGADQPEAGWCMQVNRLQQLVSELLIKNEQLRMALSATQQTDGSTAPDGADLEKT
jgi:hypothetical protein